MALICPACGTENRSVAKFCIECIKPLPADFPATQVLTAPAASPALEEMPAALAAFASANSGPPTLPQLPISVPDLASAPPPAAARLGLGIGVGVGVTIFALLLAGAMGWLAAGGQFWGNGDERAATATPAVAAQLGARGASGLVEAANAAPAPMPAGASVPAPQPTPMEALAPGEAIVQPEPAKRPAEPAMAALAPASAAAVASVNPPSVPPAHSARTQAPAAKPEHAPHLFARCEGLGFISSSRCKVDVCETAANRQRRECQPVLAQQRQMEEKRNPTLAN